MRMMLRDEEGKKGRRGGESNEGVSREYEEGKEKMLRDDEGKES